MFTLSVIIGSAVLHRDFEHATADRFEKFIGGCLLTFFGVFLITSGRRRDVKDEFDEESDEEGEERIDLAEHEATGEAHESDKYGTVRRLTVSQDGEDSSPYASRRSSHVSFQPSSIRPETPRVNSTSQPPSVLLTPSAAISHSSLSEPSLISNPWRTSQDELHATRHPGMVATSSTPVLPTEAQIIFHESLRPVHPRTESQQDLHTHPNLQGHAPPTPDLGAALRPVTPAARHSITRSMIPGPFLNPLSSPLSAVVADNLRRGVDSAVPRKRPRLGIRRTKSGSQRMESESGADELGSSPLIHHQSVDDRSSEISKSLGTESEWMGRTRGRAMSLSNALGDFFTFRRQGGATESRDEEAEAGPSGEA